MEYKQIRNLGGLMLSLLRWTSEQRNEWLRAHRYVSISAWSNWLYGFSIPRLATIVAMERELSIPRIAWTIPIADGVDALRPHVALVERVITAPVVVEEVEPQPAPVADVDPLAEIDAFLAETFAEEDRAIDKFLDELVRRVELEAHLGPPVEPKVSYTGTRVRTTWLRPDPLRRWAA